MNKNEIVENINYIKDVISSSTEYTNVSGKANILCGIMALVGCYLTDYLAGKDLFSQKITYNHPFVWIWFIIFIFAISVNMFFMQRKAHKTGQPAWSRLARMIFDAIFPAIIVGAFLTLYCIENQAVGLVPIIWMGMYGLGVWCASLFSIRAVRFLGASFIITALISLFFLQQHAMLMMAVSFGGYHIIHGCWLCYKYGD